MTNEASKTQLPVVCTLTPETVSTRRAGLLPGLMTRANQLAAIEDGYRLRFTASDTLLADIAATLAAERRCCRFLTFTVTVEPDEGPVWLEVSGPPGTREFLDALMA